MIFLIVNYRWAAGQGADDFPDNAFKASLSEVAKRANEIVAAIRQDEIEHIWRKPAPVGNEELERFVLRFLNEFPLTHAGG